jgi:hypothetical protein
MFARGAQIPCWSTRTTEETERVVLAHGVPQPSEAGPVVRRVQLVRRDGRDVSTLYGREGGGGLPRRAAPAPSDAGGGAPGHRSPIFMSHDGAPRAPLDPPPLPTLPHTASRTVL